MIKVRPFSPKPKTKMTQSLETWINSLSLSKSTKELLKYHLNELNILTLSQLSLIDNELFEKLCEKCELKYYECGDVYSQIQEISKINNNDKCIISNLHPKQINDIVLHIENKLSTINKYNNEMAELIDNFEKNNLDKIMLALKNNIIDYLNGMKNNYQQDIKQLIHTYHGILNILLLYSDKSNKSVKIIQTTDVLTKQDTSLASSNENIIMRLLNNNNNNNNTMLHESNIINKYINQLISCEHLLQKISQPSFLVNPSIHNNNNNNNNIISFAPDVVKRITEYLTVKEKTNLQSTCLYFYQLIYNYKHNNFSFDNNNSCRYINSHQKAKNVANTFLSDMLIIALFFLYLIFVIYNPWNNINKIDHINDINDFYGFNISNSTSGDIFVSYGSF